MNPAREIDATLLREEPVVPPGPANPLFHSSLPLHCVQQHRPQSLLPLPRLAAAREPGDHAVERVRRVDHRRVFRGRRRPSTAARRCIAWTPARLRAVYPDGYELGRELGIDTGEIERHRAFYIIDRTMPVGFQRGQDLNTEKAILVNRFIE